MRRLICQTCGNTYPLQAAIWRCPCGGLLDITMEISLDPQAVRCRAPHIWRYREALPIEADQSIVTLGEGFTPLLEVDVAGHPVLIKQDQLSPTGSYKDRGAAVLISQVRTLGIDRVVEDSSGNAGAAIAAYCARAGIACDIYVPASTAPAKLAQISAYGARLHRIPGSREDTARAALDAAQDCYYASHSWNPFFFHGTKTWAYEVCEQLGWQAPDTVVLPVGNGTLLLGAAIGFRELVSSKVIRRMPKLVGIQAEGCAPIKQAFEAGSDVLPSIVKGQTLAEGIAIAAPIRGAQILREIRQSGGVILAVSDADIQESLQQMGLQGFFIEPTSAATIAGLTTYLQTSDQYERIVSVFTGHGLKHAGH